MRPLRREDEGFTLIELLVVIIIIGILSAIAIPVFLNQRQKGYDAQAKHDLRNLANFQEIYFTDATQYGTIASIQAIEPKLNISKGVTLSVVWYQPVAGYCISALSQSGHTYWWDSRAAGLQPYSATGCPVTTTGLPGDSETSP